MSVSRPMQQIIPALRSYLANSYRIRILLEALVSAIVADGIITKYLVFNSLASEGNPFLYHWVGEDTFLTFKFLACLLASFYL